MAAIMADVIFSLRNKHMTDAVRQRYLREKQVLLTWVLKGFCVMALWAVALLFVAWVRIEGTRLGYDIALLHEQKQQLKDQRRLLLLEINTRKRPQHLYPMLQKRLGLTTPALNQIQRMP